ncbi:YcaO-like family protein [Micromonosporaceae bacterium Da 78-11]
MTVPHTPGPGRDGISCREPGPGPQSPIASRTRVLTGLGGLPARLRLGVTDLADHRGGRPWQSDRQAFGTSWYDDAQAAGSAWAEAAERHCAAVAPDPARLRYGSFAELDRHGVPCLHPDELVLYSADQYAAAGFPFRRFTVDSPAHWIEGRAAGTGEPLHVPAFLVFTGWRQMPHLGPEPHYAFPAIGGTAAGRTLDAAVDSGLAEVIERDTTARWWAQAAPLPALPLTDGLRALVADSGRDFETRVILLPTEFGIPVAAAAVRSSDEGWLTYGSAARADPHEAAAKALAEAYTLQLTCRALDDPRAVPYTPGRPSPLKAWRADRRYLDSYRPDHGDLVEQICHQQLYLDPRAAERVAPWAWDLPVGSWPRPGATDARPLVDRAGAAGHRVLHVDLTTPEARAAGLHVTRVIVPGTAGTAPAAYPYLGGGRLQLALPGLPRREDRAGTDLCMFPMPHS